VLENRSMEHEVEQMVPPSKLVVGCRMRRLRPAEVRILLEVDATVAVAETGAAATVTPFAATVGRIRVGIANRCLALDQRSPRTAAATFVGSIIPGPPFLDGIAVTRILLEVHAVRTVTELWSRTAVTERRATVSARIVTVASGRKTVLVRSRISATRLTCRYRMKE
jgi:hypothetical protein